MGASGIRLHPVDAPVPLVAALLDVCASDCSVRGAVRWSGFLPAHLPAAGTARDRRKTNGKRIRVEGRRAFGRARRSSNYIPDWLSAGAPLNVAAISVFRVEKFTQFHGQRIPHRDLIVPAS